MTLRLLAVPKILGRVDRCFARQMSTQPDRSSLFDSNFWSSLRRQAASALMSSLDPSEQQELWKKMDYDVPTPPQPASTTTVKDNKEEEALVVQKSINEAVAQARIEEAGLQTQKWEKEKETIMAEAEAAAMQRVEAELRVFKFQQWQSEVDQAKTGNVQEESVVTQNVEETKAHPLLGTPLVDLAYKRVHLVAAKDLATIQVWKKQRVYRHDRAKNMAQDKMKTLHLGMPGVIGLHEDEEGKLYIIDGQHRVGMMSILSQKQDLDGFDLDRVLVEVYPQVPDYEDHAQDLFLEVNKAEPIKLVDMPGVAKSKDRQIITEGASKLMKRFPDMFKPSQRARAPHLNVDNLRDALFAADVIKRHNIKSAAALETWLLEQNDHIAEKYKSADARESVPKTALAKATKFSFYLGLDSSWYYN